jgi:hypothetical protein
MADNFPHHIGHSDVYVLWWVPMAVVVNCEWVSVVVDSKEQLWDAGEMAVLAVHLAVRRLEEGNNLWGPWILQRARLRVRVNVEQASPVAEYRNTEGKQSIR